MVAWAVPGRVLSAAACATPGYVSFTGVCALRSLDVSVLQQSLLSLDRSMFLFSFVCAWGVCLQEPVLRLYMSVNKNFCAAPGRACLQEPVLHLYASVYYIFVLHLCVSVYNSFELHLDMSAHKSPAMLYL
jgi:hypothetical protein